MSITVFLGLWYLACFAYVVALAMHRGTTVWSVVGGIVHVWIRGWQVILAAFGLTRPPSEMKARVSKARIRELERELGFDVEAGRDC